MSKWLEYLSKLTVEWWRAGHNWLWFSIDRWWQTIANDTMNPSGVQCNPCVEGWCSQSGIAHRLRWIGTIFGWNNHRQKTVQFIVAHQRCTTIFVGFQLIFRHFAHEAVAECVKRANWRVGEFFGEIGIVLLTEPTVRHRCRLLSREWICIRCLSIGEKREKKLKSQLRSFWKLNFTICTESLLKTVIQLLGFISLSGNSNQLKSGFFSRSSGDSNCCKNIIAEKCEYEWTIKISDKTIQSHLD